MYPMVELLTGVMFAALFLKLQDAFFLNTFVFNFSYAYYTVVFSLLIVITVYDLRHKIILDELSFLLGVLGFFGLFFFSPDRYLGFYPHIPTLIQFSSGFLIAVPFFLLWLISGGAWMGLGDAKLAVGLGWLLGISRILSATFIAFSSGAVVGIFLIIFSKKHGMKSELPFAPFLVMGTVLAFMLELHLFPFS